MKVQFLENKSQLKKLARRLGLTVMVLTLSEYAYAVDALDVLLVNVNSWMLDNRGILIVFIPLIIMGVIYRWAYITKKMYMRKTSGITSKFSRRVIPCLLVAATCAVVFYPEISEAATTVAAANVKGHDALTDVYDHLKGLISGAVGKIIAITSLLFGMVAAAATSNIKIIIPTGGIALAVGAGPSVIESVVGATF